MIIGAAAISDCEEAWAISSLKSPNLIGSKNDTTGSSQLVE